MLFYTKTSSLDELTSSFATFLYNKLDPDIFDKNKKKIFETKDDSHMLPHDIDELLSSKATITNFIERYKILTLFVYDSKELESGFIEDYKQKLSVEVSKVFSAYCDDISALGDDEINKIHITAYILPLEKFDMLETTFLEGIKKMELEFAKNSLADNLSEDDKFNILNLSLCLLRNPIHENDGRELAIRILDKKHLFKNHISLLKLVIRKSGLYPYLNSEFDNLSLYEKLALDVFRPNKKKPRFCIPFITKASLRFVDQKAKCCLKC
ncbi:hypothetical protein LDO48_17865 [Pantoea agglomerans]|nr:hypothetical protein [Pantoea agglomerans]